jgi:hypothetical protein
MKTRPVLQIVSLLALAGLILPSILFLAGFRLDLDMVKRIMLIATIVWFVAAIPWMWKDDGADQQNAA